MTCNNKVPSKHLSIIGIPFCGGQPKAGVDHGPDALRGAGIKNTITQLGWEVVHDEDIKIAPKTVTTVGKLKNPHWVGAVCKDVSDYVYERIKGGEMSINIGGDHSIATGTIAAVLKARPETLILWVDAHADINTPLTTDSGNIHGMPVAFLAKMAGVVPGFEWLQDVPVLNTDRLVYIGLRDVDAGEKEILRAKNIKHYTAEDVARLGIKTVMDEVIAYTKELPVHISFDIDALDPAHAPATGTPVADGITLEDGKHICQRIGATGRLVSLDLVEINPSLSDSNGAGITHDSAIQLVKAALGARRN